MNCFSSKFQPGLAPHHHFFRFVYFHAAGRSVSTSRWWNELAIEIVGKPLRMGLLVSRDVNDNIQPSHPILCKVRGNRTWLNIDRCTPCSRNNATNTGCHAFRIAGSRSLPSRWTRSLALGFGMAWQESVQGFIARFLSVQCRTGSSRWLFEKPAETN